MAFNGVKYHIKPISASFIHKLDLMCLVHTRLKTTIMIVGGVRNNVLVISSIIVISRHFCCTIILNIIFKILLIDQCQCVSTENLSLL